jgi:hypothetical protein
MGITLILLFVVMTLKQYINILLLHIGHPSLIYYWNKLVLPKARVKIVHATKIGCSNDLAPSVENVLAINGVLGEISAESLWGNLKLDDEDVLSISINMENYYCKENGIGKRLEKRRNRRSFIRRSAKNDESAAPAQAIPAQAAESSELAKNKGLKYMIISKTENISMKTVHKFNMVQF